MKSKLAFAGCLGLIVFASLAILYHFRQPMPKDMLPYQGERGHDIRIDLVPSVSIEQWKREHPKAYIVKVLPIKLQPDMLRVEWSE